MSNAWKDFRSWLLGILGKPDKNSNQDDKGTLKRNPGPPSSTATSLPPNNDLNSLKPRSPDNTASYNVTTSKHKVSPTGMGGRDEDTASEDHIFNPGEKTPVYEHSNPVIRRVLDAISRGESLEVLYVIEIDRYLAPKASREYEYRTIKPLEVFNSSSWTNSVYIESESKSDVKIFRADRMALLNSDGTISIGGDVLCSSWNCRNGVRVHLGEGNQSKVDRFCTSCQPRPKPSPVTEQDDYSGNESCGLSPDNNGYGGSPPEGGPRKIAARRDRKFTPSSSDQTQTWLRRPELICQKRSGNIHYEIELDVENCNVTEVLQNGISLTGEGHKYQLSDYSGELVIEYETGPQETVSLFEGGTPLIFKLSGGWQGVGRRLKQVSRGDFLVFAPHNWERDGNPPVEPALCGDENFLVHYFSYDGEGNLHDFCKGPDRHPLPTGDAIELSGERIFDDSDQGSLFVGDIPELQVPSNVTWARVGEEKQGGWKGENFKPKDKTLKEVLQNRQGRFFIRVYDEKANLLDSAEFRYLRDLREIRMDDSPYVQGMILAPHSTKGNVGTKLQFFGVDGIYPDVEAKDNSYATVNAEGSVIVEPHPDVDKVICSLSFGKGQVCVTVNLPRIWWRLEKDDRSDNWRSTPWRMTRQKFLEYALDFATIRLSLPYLKPVKVGFDRGLERTRKASKSQEYGRVELELEMDDFMYDEQFERPNIDTSLNVQYGEFTMPLVRIPSELEPLPSSRVKEESLPYTPSRGNKVSQSGRNMKSEALRYLRLALGNPQEDFRDGQWESIEQLLNRNRVLVVQRTGWGKSMVYFLATKLLRDEGAGPTLLISPLLSLMRNQIEAAGRLQITARTINSTNSDEWEQIQNELENENKIDVLLISPERLANNRFRKNVLENLAGNVGLVVIDEAHCISDWGHDFRPDYRLILRVLEAFPYNIPVLATTATANNRVVDDIKSQLGEKIILQRGSLVRKSLKLQNINMPSPAARMAWLAKIIPTLPGSGIVYTLTKRDAERLANWLQKNDINAKAYHAGVSNWEDNDDKREQLEQQLLKNEIKVLVATVALGMGFDKPDLGFVIHFQRPASVVHYYQQVGRAGRAVDEAYGILLCGEEDDHIADYFIRNAFPSQQHISEILKILDESENGLSVLEIQSVLNLRKDQIGKMFRFLNVESPSPVIRKGYKWRVMASAADYSVDQARINKITSIRREEQQQMRDYMAHPGCLMSFLQSALEDPNPKDCGQCKNCSPEMLLDETYDDDLTNKAGLFVRRNYQPIFPRKQWPSTDMFTQSPAGRFRIPFKQRAREGRALCVWRDAGWGELVACGKYETDGFSDELVIACKEMMEYWSPDPTPKWVTCVPSLDRPNLMPDFALRLAKVLGLPFVPCVKKIKKNRPQKEMENDFQQVRNLDGVFNITDQPLSGECLLVDDMVNSRWTFTTVATLLRQAGCSAVYPMALALNSLKMD